MNEDTKTSTPADAAIKKEVKAAPTVKCQLKFKGLIQYGKAVRKVNGRKYELFVGKTTLVEAQDVEGLKKREPFLHIIEK